MCGHFIFKRLVTLLNESSLDTSARLVVARENAASPSPLDGDFARIGNFVDARFKRNRESFQFRERGKNERGERERKKTKLKYLLGVSGARCTRIPYRSLPDLAAVSSIYLTSDNTGA